MKRKRKYRIIKSCFVIHFNQGFYPYYTVSVVNHCKYGIKKFVMDISRELQILRNQIQTISSQASEYGITVEALSKQDPERPVFRSLGNILLEVSDRDSLESELKEAQWVFAFCSMSLRALS